MSELVRISISLEDTLCENLEKMTLAAGYKNRSEYIRDMIRDRFVQDQWDNSDEVLGTVTIVYNHHQRELSERLNNIQHHNHDHVLAATHVHLTHELCAEMIMVRGRAESIRKLADTLRQQRGVLHSGLTMSSTCEQLD